MIKLFNKNKVKKANLQQFYLTRNASWFLWCCQCLNIAMVAAELSSWLLAIIVLCFSWQARMIFKQSNRYALLQDKNKIALSIAPPLLVSLALFGCTVIMLTAPEYGLLISMVHLLSFSYALKAFELTSRRDFYQLILLGIFVLISSLIFKQSLAFSLLTFLLLILNLTALSLHFGHLKSLVNTFKMVSLLLSQSIILGLLLFLFFPRLEPFWQVPTAKSAQTGLADQIEPGDIANLARSNKLAFRVEFSQNELPPYKDMYWRAMTLEKYDGRRWSIAKLKQQVAKNRNNFIPTVSGQPINYQITVEPSFQKWLFALPLAVSDEVDITLLPDYTLQSDEIITQNKSYKVTSYPDSPLELRLSQYNRQLNLDIPIRSNPRLVELGRHLSKSFENPLERVNYLMERFKQEDYYYTLEPPLLTNNSLDEFFFDTKAGFCVHYASSFTFVMRAAGIPARVVTGYLGGEVNQLSSTKDNSVGHVNVYQYDAHAWSEVWIKNQGWVRFDPTGAVDPSRVEDGFSEQLRTQQANLTSSFFSLHKLKKLPWINELRLSIDALDYQWTKWVIGYTTDKQYQLLSQWFGQIFAWKVALVIAVFIVITMLCVFASLKVITEFKNKKTKKQPWQALYDEVLEKLARKGISREPSSTSNQFSLNIGRQHPELAIAFASVNLLFNQLSYQVLSNEQRTKLLIKFRKQVNTLLVLIKKIK